MSGALPWFKFYPSAWLADPGLRACSAAARGLWIDLICIMHDAKPYGHLLINGKRPSYYRISQIVGLDLRVVKRLMAQLEKTGVFTCTSTGEVTSRRMVRDKAKSQLGQGFSKYYKGVIPNALDTRKKERGPTKEKKVAKKANGYAKAQHGVLHVLSSKLGVGYAEAMDMLAADPDLCDRATRAEMRKPGEGVQVAVMGLQKILRGK